MWAKNKKCIKISVLGLVVCGFMLVSCDSSDNLSVQKVDSSDLLSDQELQRHQAQVKRDANTFHFGFDLRASPQEDAAQYIPFLKYLEESTGYRFKLHFTPKTSTAADELGMNKAQFSAMGATSFIYAQNQYGAQSLVRGVNMQGKAEYQSVLVVKSDSPIKSIKDIKGRRLAFGSEDSTQGHLIPRIMLLKNNLPLNSFSAYTYTGSHLNCAEAVVSGNYDVCGMQDQLAKSLASRGQLKIIHTSRYYPSSGIVANYRVPAEVVDKVKKALLSFKPQGEHAGGLYNWEKTEMPNGFVDAKQSDYDNLREWAFKLGFIQEKGSQE